MFNIFVAEMGQGRATWKREEMYHIMLQLAASLFEISTKILE